MRNLFVPYVRGYLARFVYENDANFGPLPTMGTLPGIGFLEKLVEGEIPGLNINMEKLLHAEHYLKIHRLEREIRAKSESD